MNMRPEVKPGETRPGDYFPINTRHAELVQDAAYWRERAEKAEARVKELEAASPLYYIPDSTCGA